MLYSITGKIVLTEPHTAVIECGGIAYRLTVSANTLAQLAGKNGEIRLFTYLQVREDALELYGFYDTEELSAFRLLISVSGVGPKAAMSILSLLTYGQFAIAVSTGDTKSISRASGVGAKTAARIVLELKDKLRASAGAAEGEQKPISGAAVSGGQYSEALNALLVLGYTRTEAEGALSTLNTSSMSLEEMITAALKKLMR